MTVATSSTQQGEDIGIAQTVAVVPSRRV